MIKLTMPGERPVSWNDFYSGQHWHKRKQEAERVHWLVRSVIPPDAKPFINQIKIILTAYFAKQPIDASNICAKLYEDGLKGWLIEDDSPKYVRSVETVSLIDRTNPRVEIILEEI